MPSAPPHLSITTRPSPSKLRPPPRPHPRPQDSLRVLVQVPDDHPGNDEKRGGPCADPDPAPHPAAAVSARMGPARPKTPGISPAAGVGRQKPREGRRPPEIDRQGSRGSGGAPDWAGDRVGAHPSREAGSSESGPPRNLPQAPRDCVGRHPPPAAKCSWHPRSTASRSGPCGRQLGPRGWPDRGRGQSGPPGCPQAVLPPPFPAVHFPLCITRGWCL